MPIGRADRRWFVVGAVVAVGIAAVAGLAQPWSNEPGTARVEGRGPGGAGETEVIETGVVLEYSVAGVAEWRGGLVAVTTGGEIVRSDDARRWETVPATGFTPQERDREECAGDSVRGVAARNDVLVAVGQSAVPPEPGDDYCDARLKVWRSTNATSWDVVEPSGLAETDEVDAVVADATGFYAFGSPRLVRSEGEEGEEPAGRGLTVWRSLDGVTWEALPTVGLSKPQEYKYQSVSSVGLRDGRMLAAAGTECIDCFDDHALAFWRSEGTGAWTELAVSGLDALDQANTDIVPAVAATGDGYLAFASVGKEHSDDRTPALWSSPDGERWEQSELEGPSPIDGSIDVAIASSRGVVALDATRSGLVVWRVEAR